MKKKYIVILLIVVFGLGIGVDKLLFTNNDIDDGFNDLSQIEHKNMLSMMLEQNAGLGDYSLETRSSWPTKEDGYVFNSTLSKCEKGSKLSWDKENNAVIVQTNVLDKCYVYFDVYVEPKTLLADYIKFLYNGTQGENNLYYHDSNLANGAGDKSYRYAGTHEETNNFVCFGSNETICPDDNLNRIVGVFEDKVKLIKWDYATTALLGIDGDYTKTYSDDNSSYKGDNSNLTSIGAYHWNKANYDTSYNDTNYYNDWSYSELNITNLNSNFLNNIGSMWANMIDMTIWKVGGFASIDVVPSILYTNEITSP